MGEVCLEEQFLQLVQIMEQMQRRMIEIENNSQILVNSNRQLIDWVDMLEKDVVVLKNNMKYELSDPRVQNESIWYPRIASHEKTLELLIKEGKSISRFGDGEFATINGEVRHKFQTDIDMELARRLKEVLGSNQENLLVAIADNYGDLSKYTDNAQREIRYYMTEEVRRTHLELLEKEREYHDAYISRPYAMYRDNVTDAPEERFEMLKKLWQGKKCVFVEGEKTRMGVGNDLFAETESIQRILAPAENAFRCYEKILAECMKMPKDSVFILALGPTATVLAYDLCEVGYQALDLGHLDLEYEWFLKGQRGRAPVMNKYNNELPGGEKVEEVFDEAYLKQIVARMV